MSDTPVSLKSDFALVNREFVAHRAHELLVTEVTRAKGVGGWIGLASVSDLSNWEGGGWVI